MNRDWSVYKIAAMSIILLMAMVLCTAHGDTKFIRLRHETIVTTPPAPLNPRLQVTDSAVSGLYLVQCKQTIQSDWHEPLQAARAIPLQYVPEDTLLVRLDRAHLSRIRKLPFVQWVGEYQPIYRLHPTLKGFRSNSAARWLSVRVLIAADTPLQEETHIQRLLRHPQRGSPLRIGTIYQGQAAADQLLGLARSPAVLWIEPAPHYRLFDEVSAKIVGGTNTAPNHATATQSLGYDGRGVTVAVADSGLCEGDVDTLHPDLLGRVEAFFAYGPLTSAVDTHGHGTHVSGIIAGSGATGEADENGALYGLGVAPGAHLVVQRVFNGAGHYVSADSSEILTRDAVRAGALIGSHSWGNEAQGRYDLSAAEYDALVRDADPGQKGDQPFLLVFAAGNAGPGIQTMSSPATAKNVIATGASQNDRRQLLDYRDGPDVLASFSSRGPCEDGRIKPDLVAPGTWIASLQSAAATEQYAWMPISADYQFQGGTSQAGPHVAGAAAVFVQYYRSLYTNATPSPALMKAALINSAIGLGGESEEDMEPDHQAGWGRVNLSGLIQSSRRFDFVDQTELLTTGNIYERSYLVGNAAQPLKITLAYTDVPGLPAAIPALVNDLDLEVIGPDGTVYRGNQFADGQSRPQATATDNVNNVEAVHLPRSLAGIYQVRVHARNVVSDARTDTPVIDQDFALVLSGDLPLPGEGVLTMNQTAFTVPDFIQLTLIDPDLAGQSSVPIELTSSSHPIDLKLVLTAVGDGVFTGGVVTALAPSVGNDRLSICPGDTITARYKDAAPAGWRTATAQADLKPPSISQIQVTNHYGKIRITWQTDEPTTSVVRFGVDTNSWRLVTNGVFRQNQAVLLNSVAAGVTNWFVVTAVDVAGNQSTEDNQGHYYSFFIPANAAVLLVNAYVPDDLAPNIPVTAYTETLDQCQVQYDLWDAPQLGRTPNLDELRRYRAVIWRISDSIYAETNTLEAAQQTTLQDYLKEGGSLLLASMELLNRLGTSSFISNVLQVQDYEKDAGVPAIIGVENDPITSGMASELDYSQYPSLGGFNVGPDFSETLVLTTNAAPILLDSATGRAAGLRYPMTGQDSAGRLVFLSFPLDTVPVTGEAPNNRATLVRNILRFLIPGLQGLGTITLDKAVYTSPARVIIEVADADLAGQGQLSVNFSGGVETNEQPVLLRETVRPGLFRGFIVLAATNDLTPTQRHVNDGDRFQVEYFDASAKSVAVAAAVIDLQKPLLEAITVTPEVETAVVQWTTSKPTDALVQYGESTFLGRTAYRSELATSHTLKLEALTPDRNYFFQVVNRDAAGNVVIDNNQGRLHQFHTKLPRFVPWRDDLETGATDWSVVQGEGSDVSWQLGVPDNGRETNSVSLTNAWGSNLSGAPIEFADTALISPALWLSGEGRAALSFRHSYAFGVSGDLDHYELGQLKISTNNGLSWRMLTTYTNGTTGWEQEELDLTPYLGKVIRLQWFYGFSSFAATPRPGWLVDDVAVLVDTATHGLVKVTSNLAQARFTVNGPTVRNGLGWDFMMTNAPVGTYRVSFRPVPYYETPPAQTNKLTATNVLIFTGNYTFVDANQNQLPDAWEKRYYGNLVTNDLAVADTDHDGLSDYSEFITGTDPTQANSVLRLYPPKLLPQGEVQLVWPSAKGRAYRVIRSLDALTWNVYSDWSRADNGLMTLTVPPGTNDIPHLFRLEVKP